MKKIIIFLFFFMIGLSAFGNIPQQITIQGKLRDSYGSPVANQAKNFTFSFYDAETGGNKVYEETVPVTTSSRGIFSTRVGNTNSFPNLDFRNSYWLEIKVEGKPVGSRQPLTSAPYVITVKNQTEGTVIASPVGGSGQTGIRGTGSKAGGYFQSSGGAGLYGSSLAAGNYERAFKADWVEITMAAGDLSAEKSFADKRTVRGILAAEDNGNGISTPLMDPNLAVFFDESSSKLKIVRTASGAAKKLKVLLAYQSGGKSIPGDTTLPKAVSNFPVNSATSVPLNTTVTATLSKAMDAATINTANFKLSSTLGPVAGAVSYNDLTKTITFIPAGLLANGITYTATLGVGIKDLDGRNVEADYAWSFTTKTLSARLLYRINGAAAGDIFGWSVNGTGDINKDGYPDFIVSSPYASGNSGIAKVFSGYDVSPLYQFNGNKLGWQCSGTGDVNKDGYADFIVGNGNASPEGRSYAGSAYVYSGKDGSLIYQKNGEFSNDWCGISNAGIGDINKDGYDDFAIGASGSDPGGLNGAGSVMIYSGKDGSLIYRINGDQSGIYLGHNTGQRVIAGIGDVNADGYPDFIIGGYMRKVNGIYVGSAFVYSGADGSLLYQKDGTAAVDYFGGFVSGVGDINRDGRSDFIISAPYADPGGLTDAGSVFLYSGADGSLLYRIDGKAINDRIMGAEGVGDLNGDGTPDFIIVYPTSISICLYSGADGSLLYRIDGNAEDRFSGCLKLGDINGDGKPDFIISGGWADPGGLIDAGSVYIYVSE